ncbi:hypothetical protein NRIC_22500 [Enterococcus florum]|uniref:SWIM-type domain-containing protein n=1 Tax=Enterococcus florum TaxID=2480627 RepID=A0A4V0WPM3_9ENTE|nr:hypothetical protein [Enterococcus florum]GCF94359.1 hypothetical protein NRIC_22500 [Enterococcus florum]
MIEWQSLFRPYILERGFDYYDEKRVIDSRLIGDTIHALVDGNETYMVEIEGLEDDPPAFYCECPYAEEGNHCKHMAAVLFEYEAGKAALSSRSAERNLRYYQREIDRAIRRFTGYESYLEYDQVTPFVQKMNEVLTNTLFPLTKMGDYQTAFQAVNYLVREVDQIEMNDEEGELYQLADLCQSIWMSALQQADSQEKQGMYQWFASQLKHSTIHFCQWEIAAIVEKYFG